MSDGARLVLCAILGAVNAPLRQVGAGAARAPRPDRPERSEQVACSALPRPIAILGIC